MTQTTLQPERWAEYVADARPLWERHYLEVASDPTNIKLRPDEALFAAMEAEGRLVLITARNGAELVGYILGFIRPHPHYIDVLCGFEDAHYLTPEHRKGMTGVRLIKALEAAFRDRGCQLALIHSKASKAQGAIFERLGYAAVDVVYRKRLS